MTPKNQKPNSTHLPRLRSNPSEHFIYRAQAKIRAFPVSGWQLAPELDEKGQAIPGAAHTLLSVIHETALERRAKDAVATRTFRPGYIIPSKTLTIYHDSLSLQLADTRPSAQKNVCGQYAQLLPKPDSHECYELHLAQRVDDLVQGVGFPGLTKNEHRQLRENVLPFMFAVYGLSITYPIHHP